VSSRLRAKQTIAYLYHATLLSNKMEPTPSATTWMNLQRTMLKKKKSQKVTHCIIPFEMKE
jgi:hypothetical protein